jgi:hypothetical protein
LIGFAAWMSPHLITRDMEGVLHEGMGSRPTLLTSLMKSCV